MDTAGRRDSGGLGSGRTKKKRTRYDLDESEPENQPPSALAKLSSKENILGKAAAEAYTTPQQVLGAARSPLQEINARAQSPDIDLVIDDEDIAEEPLVAWERPAGVGCPGQLKSLTLINFMCHEHLQMEFGPNVNFISGQNGSGKSAVLQAIQQVLGVRARDTGRATNQAAFIKAGCPEARITIKLWNEGPQAHLPELFGKEIVLERRIDRTASCAVKTASGQKVGQKKEDLLVVLEALAINAANPISVMTQDTTRSFMEGNARRDHEKYEIYMEATMLARIVDANTASGHQLASMRAEVESEAEKHNILARQLKELEKKLEGLHELEDMVKEESALQHALVWAIVASDVAELEKLEQQAGTDGPTARDRAAAELTAAREDLELLESSIETQQAAYKKHERDMELLRSRAKVERERQTALARDATSRSKVVISKQKDKEAKSAQYEELMAIVRESEAELYNERQAAMQKFKAQESTIQIQQDENAAKLFEAFEAHRTFNKEIIQMQKTYDAKRESLDCVKRRVEYWEAECMEWEQICEEPLSKFGGHNAVEVSQVIQTAAARFHRLPIGPIGHLLTLHDKMWAQPVENAMGAALNAFLVHDGHDYGVLKQLCSAANLDFPPCVIGALDLPMHAVEKGLPPRHIQTMFHILRCSDDEAAAAVVNMLIDEEQIEKHALALSEGELFAATQHNNVVKAWQPDGSVMWKRQRTSTYFPPSRDQKKPRVGIDDPENLKQLRSSLEAAQDELTQLERDVAEMHETLALKRKERPKFAAPVQDLKVVKRDLDAKLGNLLRERELESMAHSGGGDGGIKEDLHFAEQDVIRATRKLHEQEVACEKAIKAADDSKTRLDELRSKIDGLETTNRQIVEDQSIHEEYLEAACSKVEARLEFCEELNKRLELVVEVKERCAEKCADHKEKAAQVCPEEEGIAALESYKASLRAKKVPEKQIGPGHIHEVIGKKLDRLQKKIKEQEAMTGGMRDVLESRLKKSRAVVKRSARHLAELKQAYCVLQDGLQAREQQYNRMEKLVEETVNRRFNYYLDKKGHNGSIEISATADERTGIVTPKLEIKVTIDGSTRNGKVKDLKQLSGGERSFTTVAFALAVGEFTGSPFRAMDEFDVFMDAINRQTSVESLLTNALEHKDLQFLFLTPLDISAVEGAKVKIREKGLEISDSFVRISKMRAAR